MTCSKNKLDSLEKLIELIKSNFHLLRIGNCKLWSNAGWHQDPGPNRTFDIAYFIEGSHTVHIKNSSLYAKSGDIVFFDNSIGSTCENSKFKFFAFKFVVIDNQNKNIWLHNEISTCFQSISKLSLDKKLCCFEKLYIEMLQDYTLREIYHELKERLAAVNILIELRRSAINNDRQKNNRCTKRYTDLISDIIAFLSKNLYRHISLEEISEQYSLNERYLNRIFKKATGYPIMKYHQIMRIDAAKNLLVTSSLSITDIALELNFASSQYFSYSFKASVNMTPSQFREMSREGWSDQLGLTL